MRKNNIKNKYTYIHIIITQLYIYIYIYISIFKDNQILKYNEVRYYNIL